MSEAKDTSSQLEMMYGAKARKYLQYADEIDDIVGDEVGQKILKRLLNGEKTLDNDILRQLNEYTLEALKSTDSVVAGPLSELKHFLEPRVEGLHSKNVALMLYGSLQYGDPKNMDVDLLACAMSADAIQSIDGQLDQMFRDMIPYWKSFQFRGKPRGEPTISSFSLERSNIDSSPFRESEADSEFEYGSRLSMIMTGLPVFSSDARILAPIKRQASKILASDPLLCAVANVGLADTLETRLGRRGMTAQDLKK